MPVPLHNGNNRGALVSRFFSRDANTLRNSLSHSQAPARLGIIYATGGVKADATEPGSIEGRAFVFLEQALMTLLSLFFSLPPLSPHFRGVFHLSRVRGDSDEWKNQATSHVWFVLISAEDSYGKPESFLKKFYKLASSATRIVKSCCVLISRSWDSR